MEKQKRVKSLTVTSKRKSSMQLKSWLMYWGSLRIMPGALSRASHSVTRNSAASCLIPSGNWEDWATCTQALSMSKISGRMKGQRNLKATVMTEPRDVKYRLKTYVGELETRYGKRPVIRGHEAHSGA